MGLPVSNHKHLMEITKMYPFPIITDYCKELDSIFEQYEALLEQVIPTFIEERFRDSRKFEEVDERDNGKRPRNPFFAKTFDGVVYSKIMSAIDKEYMKMVNDLSCSKENTITRKISNLIFRCAVAQLALNDNGNVGCCYNASEESFSHVDTTSAKNNLVKSCEYLVVDMFRKHVLDINKNDNDFHSQAMNLLASYNSRSDTRLVLPELLILQAFLHHSEHDVDLDILQGDPATRQITYILPNTGSTIDRLFFPNIIGNDDTLLYGHGYTEGSEQMLSWCSLNEHVTYENKENITTFYSASDVVSCLTGTEAVTPDDLQVCKIRVPRTTQFGGKSFIKKETDIVTCVKLSSQTMVREWLVSTFLYYNYINEIQHLYRADSTRMLSWIDYCVKYELACVIDDENTGQRSFCLVFVDDVLNLQKIGGGDHFSFVKSLASVSPKTFYNYTAAMQGLYKRMCIRIHPSFGVPEDDNCNLISYSYNAGIGKKNTRLLFVVSQPQFSENGAISAENDKMENYMTELFESFLKRQWMMIYCSACCKNDSIISKTLMEQLNRHNLKTFIAEILFPQYTLVSSSKKLIEAGAVFISEVFNNLFGDNKYQQDDDRPFPRIPTDDNSSDTCHTLFEKHFPCSHQNSSTVEDNVEEDYNDDDDDVCENTEEENKEEKERFSLLLAVDGYLNHLVSICYDNYDFMQTCLSNIDDFHRFDFSRAFHWNSFTQDTVSKTTATTTTTTHIVYDDDDDDEHYYKRWTLDVHPFSESRLLSQIRTEFECNRGNELYAHITNNFPSNPIFTMAIAIGIVRLVTNELDGGKIGFWLDPTDISMRSYQTGLTSRLLDVCNRLSCFFIRKWGILSKGSFINLKFLTKRMNERFKCELSQHEVLLLQILDDANSKNAVYVLKDEYHSRGFRLDRYDLHISKPPVKYVFVQSLQMRRNNKNINNIRHREMKWVPSRQLLQGSLLQSFPTIADSQACLFQFEYDAQTVLLKLSKNYENDFNIKQWLVTTFIHNNLRMHKKTIINVQMVTVADDFCVALTVREFINMLGPLTEMDANDPVTVPFYEFLVCSVGLYQRILNHINPRLRLDYDTVKFMAGYEDEYSVITSILFMAKKPRFISHGNPNAEVVVKTIFTDLCEFIWKNYFFDHDDIMAGRNDLGYIPNLFKTLSTIFNNVQLIKDGAEFVREIWGYCKRPIFDFVKVSDSTELYRKQYFKFMQKREKMITSDDDDDDDDNAPLPSKRKRI